MPLPIATERLTIRPFEQTDAEDLLRLFGDARVLRYWNSPPLHDMAEARDAAERFSQRYRALGFAQFRVSQQTDGAFVGAVGLQVLRADGVPASEPPALRRGDEIEVTYALVPEQWGRGFCTEAARACLDYGFDELRLAQVVGIARAANRGSLHVMDKLGMRWLGEATYFGSSWIKYVLARDDR